ncbi:MAG TPA: formyltetrahydrofolate deformylase [Chthoniobacterales bacterium]|nr:formyltetrahydrofolate deformylase [Chthoniobacterales bacterium]
MDTLSIVALLYGPDQRGLVARVAGWIFDNEGNILHADQHRDPEENIFFQRVEWIQPGNIATVRRVADAFAIMAREKLGMTVRVALSHEVPRIGALVSKVPHCLQDIAYKSKRGEIRGELACVVSNQTELQAFCASISLPFHHVEPQGCDNRGAEDALLEIFRLYKVDLIIMARYTQVLSSHFLQSASIPVISIHHSFLPAFPGGRPYQQAYSRGVKLIGATAHYAAPSADKGPIIAQDVVRISQRHSIADLIEKGRDLEQLVLAQAVRLHLENRVLSYNNRTVVFD